MATQEGTQSAEYSGAFCVRCPESLPPAIKRAARQNMTTAASYIRAAVLHQLKIDGCSPSNGGDGE
jgi:predicted HicB family RNase H-like nuclease